MTTSRDLRVDCVRGIALVSMFVAHCAPSPGPAGVLNLSEYLTYPIFAALVGVGADLGGRRRQAGAGAWWAGVLVRGAVLVAVGLLLERAQSQVLVVLVHLGLLTWVAAPLGRARTGVVAGVGAAAFVLAPVLRDQLLDERLSLVVGGHPTIVRLLDLVVTGDSYRLTSLVFFAAVGILLARAFLARPVLVQLAVGAALAVLAAAYVTASQAGAFEMAPYEATHREHLFDTILLGAVFLIGVGLAGAAARATRPLAAMGQLSLTIYTLQILWLAYYVRVLHPGQRDDSWSNVLLLTAGSLVAAWAWQRVVRRGVWRRGPLEGATTLLAQSAGRLVR